jgi:hypothetical protein
MSFRHAIGDSLYELVHPYECNDDPDYVAMWPVVKVTGQYVYVTSRHHWERERVGEIYMVRRVDVGRSSSTLILWDFPDREFNTVMFEAARTDDEDDGQDGDATT